MGRSFYVPEWQRLINTFLIFVFKIYFVPYRALVISTDKTRVMHSVSPHQAPPIKISTDRLHRRRHLSILMLLRSVEKQKRDFAPSTK